jgi:hypothetical protein
MGVQLVEWTELVGELEDYCGSCLLLEAGS